MIYLRTLSTLPRCSVQHALAAPAAFSLKHFFFPLFSTNLSNHRMVHSVLGKNLTPLAHKSKAVSRVVFTKKLKFSSADVILAFFSENPLKKKLERKRILQTIALKFANKELTEVELQQSVLLIFYFLKQEGLHIPMHLATDTMYALQDCAKEGTNPSRPQA